MPDNFAYIENNGNYFLAGARNKYYIIDSIGYNLNNLESNGNYSLAEGGIYNQYYIFDNNGNSIGLTDSSGNPVSSNNGYSVVQAEEGPDGGFHVLWSGPQGIIPSSGPIMAWKVDASGQYQNHIFENIDYHETTFQVDLNGGGISTLSHDNIGLTDISGNLNHIINNSVVLKNIHGAPVGPDTFGKPAYLVDGVPQKTEWNAVQVEQNAAGGFEVMWIDVGSDTPLDPLAWKTEVTGKYITHKILTDELRNAHESSYKVDLDGDGRVTLETNGVYELAISGNQYQIIEIGGGSLNYLESNDDYKLAKGGDQFYIVDSSGNSIRYGEGDYIKSLRVDGWTDLQVEETDANWGGFEVLYYNESWIGSNGGYMSHRFNAAGEHQTLVYQSVDRHESWFQVDLNNDGNIASESHNRYGGLTDISGNKHHEVDGYGASGTATSFSKNSDGWSATQVEAGSESGTFEVFWSNGGRSGVTSINNNGKYQSTITREMVAHETVFKADLDGDNVIGLNLVSIETNGSHELSTSHNQYYIIDSNDNIVTSFGSSNMGAGWSATQVEASAGGGFEVFWSHTDGRTTAHKISNSGVYESTITRTIVQHETAFQADLDSDNFIGLNLVSIETNGSYELATSHSQYYIIDRSDSSIVTSFGSSNMGNGWSATQVEASAGGGFEVFWSHTDGRTTAHKISNSGVYESTITRTIDQHETAFQADLDSDNFIGLNLVSIETNGSYELATSNNNYQIIDRSDSSVVTSFSKNSDGWSATQVEAGSESGTFEVFWSNGGRSGVTSINNNGKYQSTITREMVAHETVFKADLDGDNVIGLNLVSIETNGSHELSTSHNQYYIIDSNDNIVTSFGSSNMGAGWSATQVEASAGGGFEVFWSHTDGRTTAHKISNSGVYESTITRTIVQHETAFQADLDSDNFIGLNLVSIETNGSYELATSHSQYYIIDRSDSSIVTSFGSSNMGNGWSATQVEASAGGGFEVFWSHTDGRTTAHKISNSGVYESTITRTIDQHETAFQADLDSDNFIGLNLVSIETNGSYELATSNNNYQIIDRSDSSVVTSFSKNSDGWSATQVEAGSESGTFEVFWSNGGRSGVTSINNNGKYQSTITREMVAHETVFKADLDGDNVIGLNLVSIETNGSHELSTSHNQYYIIDSNDNIVTSFGSSNMGAGWSATQVEASAGGGFEVFWSHTDGRTTAHKISNSGVYESTITRTIVQHETAFQADLDSDNFIGLNLVSIETNGSYELATSHSQYYIIDRSDSSIVTSFGSSNMGNGWSATQVEASAGGGFEVFWSHTDGRTTAHKISNSGVYESTITRTIDQHETAFQADLDSDNFIGLNLVSIETNGSYELATSNNNYQIIDRSDSSVVTSFSKNSDGWSATQVEAGSESGTFEVFWSNGGRSGVTSINNNGKYQSTITREMVAHETVFKADLDGDNVIGLNLVSIETNGSHELSTSHNQYYIIDSNDNIVTSFGSSNMGAGWSATQVEASAGGGFEVFWSHTDGRTTAHKISNSGVYESTITRTIVQHETAFQADLDSDNFIGLNLVSIETNGSYELATSHSQYYIIDRSDSSIVTSFGSSNMGNGWSATQVEASAGGGFEVFWSHTDGRTTAHKISNSGVYESTITRTIDQHETAFQADLDSDNFIGLNLVSIETNGSYELATSNNNYQIIDRSDSSVVTSFSKNSDGWSATQVEAGSESGTFEVFWSNGGRSGVTSINNNGKYQSTITREMVAHETAFQADLDGDGLTTIETNGDFKIFGGSGNDTIYGGIGDDTLDGGTGKDIITTGSGSDEIYLRIGDGGNALLDADIITDFTDGSDTFGLTNGLSFGDLTRSQGTDDYANDTIIKYGSEYLAILQNIDVSHLTEADFVNVDIA